MTKDIIERLERRMPATQDMDSTNMCEDMEDAIALISSQAKRIAELDAEIAALKEGKFWRDELLRASIEDRKRAIAALRRLDARFVEAEADTNSETGTLGETFATIDVSHLRKITTAAIGCHCGNCTEVSHASDCAVHNAPAMPVGPCDCRARATLKGER